MTARHKGDDRPHKHVVDPVMVALDFAVVRAHVPSCVVCRPAYANARQVAAAAGYELVDAAKQTPEERDRFTEATYDDWCPVGQELMLNLGRSALGKPVFE